MATPKYAERVAILETKFDALKETVEAGFEKLGDKIDAASLNGETPRVKFISKRLGDPQTVETIESMVEAHNRRAWLLRPLGGVRTGVINAALWTLTGAALVGFHAWLHSVVPSIP